MSGLPFRAKYKHFKSILEHTLDCFQLFLLEVVIIGARRWNCVQMFRLLFASSQCLSMYFFACPSMSYDHATVFAWGFFHPGNFSGAVAEIRGSNISLYWSRSTLQIGSVPRLRFCWWPWRFEINLRENLLYFRKSHKLDVQKANVSVTQFYRIRDYFTGCWFANGRYPCSWFVGCGDRSITFIE